MSSLGSSDPLDERRTGLEDQDHRRQPQKHSDPVTGASARKTGQRNRREGYKMATEVSSAGRHYSPRSTRTPATRSQVTRASWLEVDMAGFAQALSQKGIARVLLEPIANALDTSATEVTVGFDEVERAKWRLLVTDNDASGFQRLSDAWTLHAPSTHRGDPTKRGRFGQGDKELLAICSQGGEVRLTTTTGSVVFDAKGRRLLPDRCESGTVLRADLRCTKKEAAGFADLASRPIVPDGVELRITVNGQCLEVRRRDPVFSFTGQLPTVIFDGAGQLRQSRRVARISCYRPAAAENPHLYELGVPVVRLDMPWHVDVAQKVPLNRDRDNVTPGYLRQLRVLVLDAGHNFLDAGQAKGAWVADAVADATPEALGSVIKKIFGDKVVIADVGNPEATKRALEQNFSVIYGRQFKPDVFRKIKEYGIAQPAGKVIKTGVPSSPLGEPPIPEEAWTLQMRQLADYASKLGGAIVKCCG
jgi:hypothetical protein